MSDSGTGSRVGSQFGPYHLRRLLGRGGMGEVYEAEDTRKHRLVALKLVSEQFSGNPTFRARMQREADAAGRLTEPHVVPIHDYGELDGKFYVDMRLIAGTDLATVLKRFGPLSPPRAVAIVRQIAAALDAAHAVGITHRDVKPENILITDSDFAYLVDFGIARAATDPGLTQTGMAVGTYNYMAPERFTGNEVTYRADIYSLAAVLAECLTGSPPYPANSIERAIAAHLTEPPPRPSELRPGQVPVAFDPVVARGMAKDPEQRYRSAGELAAAAHDALTSTDQYRAAMIVQQSDRFEPAGQEAPTQARAWSRMSNPPTQQARTQSSTPYAVGPPAPPDFSAPPQTKGNRRLQILLGLTVLMVIAAVVIGYLIAQPSRHQASASGQSVLPFNGLDFRLSPGGVALDSDGSVYVTSEGMYGRVVKLPAGSSTPAVLPFAGLYQPQGLAVDSAGSVYVTDFNNRVVKLAAGSNNQTKLPINGLNYPEGVAVDTAGSVYVADRGNNRVVKLAAGSDTQTDLPFTDLNDPDGVAVDADGNVYVADTDNNRVVKLAAGASAQTVLPFTGLTVPWGVAVDSRGTVYVTEHDSSQVMKLPVGSNTSTVLPFTGLNTPLAVAVDKDGNVYVADRGNDRAVKLAAG
ncbi:MAG TPA: protein kinase [Mycobacterium sp.]|nr:protein kinase [Mycobacterium sp.]